MRPYSIARTKSAGQHGYADRRSTFRSGLCPVETSRVQGCSDKRQRHIRHERNSPADHGFPCCFQSFLLEAVDELYEGIYLACDHYGLISWG